MNYRSSRIEIEQQTETVDRKSKAPFGPLRSGSAGISGSASQSAYCALYAPDMENTAGADRLVARQLQSVRQTMPGLPGNSKELHRCSKQPLYG